MLPLVEVNQLPREEQEDLLTFLQDLRLNPGFLHLAREFQLYHSQVHRVLETEMDSRLMYRNQGEAVALTRVLRTLDEQIQLLDKLTKDDANG